MGKTERKTTRNNTENFNAVGLKVFAALRLKNSAHSRMRERGREKKTKSFGHKFKKIELNAITLQFFALFLPSVTFEENASFLHVYILASVSFSEFFTLLLTEWF